MWDPQIIFNLQNFGTEFHYNDVIPKLLRLFLDLAYVGPASFVVFLLGLVWIWLGTKTIPIRGISLSYMWLLFCIPTVHPWYVLPVILFMVHTPSRAWMVLSVTLCLQFWVYYYQFQGHDWEEKTWIWFGTYIPFLAVLIYDFFRIDFPWDKEYPIPESIDIVIPTLNEERNIKSLLGHIDSASKQLQKFFEQHRQIKGENDNRHLPPSIQVLIVDGGSTDKTLDIANQFETKIIKAKKRSRGMQFQEGINAGIGDVILMLHADSIIFDHALIKLYQSFMKHPRMQWGILGHHYDSSNFKMRIIEMSNQLRFQFAGIAFGDQGIFVRRHILNAVGGMPAHRLMEDVELSLRLGACPGRLDMGRLLTVSTRRWEAKKFSGYTFQVFKLVLTYLFFRRIGMNTEALSDRMYRWYYNRD